MDAVFIFNFPAQPKYQPVQLFHDEVVVVPVPSNAQAGSFPGWKLSRDADGRALPLLLNTIGRPVSRVAAMGWSAGRGGVSELLKHPADRAAIDTVFDLDGLHFGKGGDGRPLRAQAEPWIHYGLLCADASHLLVMLHTKIVPSNASKITSTTESSAYMLQELSAALAGQDVYRQVVNIDDLTSGPPPPPVTIGRPAWAGGGNVVYDAFPLDYAQSVGNAWEVAIGKGVETDHYFAQREGQLALWRAFLAPRWNQVDIACESGGQCERTTTYAQAPGAPKEPSPLVGIAKGVAIGVTTGILVSLAVSAMRDLHSGDGRSTLQRSSPPPRRARPRLLVLRPGAERSKKAHRWRGRHHLRPLRQALQRDSRRARRAHPTGQEALACRV